MRPKLAATISLFISFSAIARASDLTIHLNGSHTATQKSVQFRCDAKAPMLKLPSGVFTVDYLSAGTNRLAVLPIAGESLIFSNVSSGSGERYAAGDYIWWDAAGRSVTLTSNSLQVVSNCEPVR